MIERTTVGYEYKFEEAGNGDFIVDTAGEDLPQYTLVYRGNDDAWHKADADAVATTPSIGLTLSAIESGKKGKILMWGYVGNSDWTWTTGGANGKIYASATAGELTQTAPTGDGDIVQCVAVAFFSTGIWFDPTIGSGTPILHAASHMSGGADETRDMEFNPLTMADLTAEGLKAIVTVGENVVKGDTLYMKADGKYWKSDADAAASMPACVLVIAATIAADASGIVLHEGYYRNDDLYDWTLGNGEANLLFPDEGTGGTAGTIVQLASQPAGSGDQVQVVGWVVTANIIYFRPSLELVQVA